ALIFIDIILKRICRRDVRMLQNHRFLAGSLGLGSGVMLYSSFYNILPEAKEQLSHELSIFAGNADAFIMLFFFSGIAFMTIVHWIMHRFNSNSPSGIEHSESIQYFMPPDEGYSHQRQISNPRYSTPFQDQHAQYAPHPYHSSKNNGKHGDEDHEYRVHDTESRYQDSEYVDDEVTSLLNNAFLQIGATPASQIEEAMDRRRKKELQQQRRQRRQRRQESSDLEHEEGDDHEHGNSDHSDHHISDDSSEEDERRSIEVIIEDPHSRRLQDLNVSNNTVRRDKNQSNSNINGHPLPLDSPSSWSSLSSNSPDKYANDGEDDETRLEANGKNKSHKRFQDSGHFHNAHPKPSTVVASHPHEVASAAATSPVHHTYQTFAPPSVGGKNNKNANKSTSKGGGGSGLPQYPYSSHTKGSEEALQGTLRQTSFPRLNHRHQHQHHPYQQPSQSHGHDHDHDHSHSHSHPTSTSKHHQESAQQQATEHQPLLYRYGRRGSDPLTSSRHDILDHAATDDGEHTELADIGLQTALTIAVHKFPEGLITFLSTTTDPCLGLSVFMALAVHNLIEGYLIAFPLYIGLRSRTKAFAFAAVLGGLSQPIGALMGWLILRKVVSLGWQVSAAGVIYAMVAGMMSSIAVNGMWPQAVKCAGRQPTKVVPISFFTGIAIMGACQAVMGSKC
ncbi:hypothetical protein DFQ27_004911, partial [Actinomortierella ambigua]